MTILLQCSILTTTSYAIWAIKLKEIFNVYELLETIEHEEGAEIDVKQNNQDIAYCIKRCRRR